MGTDQPTDGRIKRGEELRARETRRKKELPKTLHNSAILVSATDVTKCGTRCISIRPWNNKFDSQL